jgi:hypothetical protein
VLDFIGGRARNNRQNLLKLRDTGRTLLLELNDTVLELIDRCSTSKAHAQDP